MKGANIYLHFKGNSHQVFLFYKTIFGGEFITAQTFGEMPGGEKMSEGNKGRMIHISMNIAPNTVLMATDTMEDEEATLVAGNNFHICLDAETEKEADKLFNALAKDGKIEMPMNKTFWGAYFGMCQDKFGIQWMINYTIPQKQA